MPRTAARARFALTLARPRLSPPVLRALVGALTLTATAVAAPTSTSPVAGAPSATRARWTDETPDAMIDDAVARIGAGRSPERDAIAAMVEIAEIEARATYGHAATALLEIAKMAPLPEDVQREAALLARSLAPDEGTREGAAADRALGVITDVALLGPFRDTGGGLVAKEGPEAPGASFADMRAHYAWGTVDVAWRAVPRAYAGASGSPLDLFVHPRKESCSIIATKITLAALQPIVVRLAAAGQARLMMDGVELGSSDDVHASALLDRIAARVDAPAGAHLVAAKVCSGALSDDGRVRLRVTDEKGAALATYAASADLRDVPGPKPAATAKGQPATARVALKVAKVVTPLARVLSAGADVNATLDAAVVRTLGGADDLKSPRAPGMLDDLTRRTDIDADRLAMAGWIAPSGANRSGWLNLARAKAEAAHDARTAHFTERRQMAEHLNARMPDWAMATRRAAALDAAKDSEAILLGALIDQGLGTDALRTQAMRALAASFQASRATAPTSLVSELSRLGSSFDPQIALATQDELARRGLRGSELVATSMSRGVKATTEASLATFDGSLDSADEGIEIARMASRAGAHDVSRQLFARMTEWAPNRAEAWAGLADEIAATPSPDGEAAMNAALRRARELAPGDARYRAEIALRQAGGRDVEAREDERYLVSPATILARRLGVPAHGAPDVADRQLHWLRAVVMHPDNRVSTLVHYAREIVIAPRTQSELYENIPYEGDLTEILRARVHRKDGGTAFPTEEHNEGSRPRIRWPDLAPGDTVEVAIRQWTSTAVGGRGDAPFYFIDYGGAPSTHPILYNEVVVETTPGHALYLDVLNGAGTFRRTDSDANGRHVTRLVWDKPLTTIDEPLAPDMTEIVPITVGSTFRTWKDFRAWYAEAVRGFTEPDEQVRRMAAELTKGKTTREAKLAALFDFVADDIRYVNYVSGEWWLPNRPQQLLARREGDCDDKAILLITLLKSIGIEAQEVMVQTRVTGQPSLLLAKNAAVPRFDHGIAFLPGPNGGTYLDATSPQSRLGPLPSMDARAMALNIDSGDILRLPASSPEDHGANVTWTIALKPDGSGDLLGEERHIGDGAFWLRSYLTQPDARVNYVENNLVGGWFPTVEVDKAIDFKGDLPSGQAWVKYKAHSEGFARHEQKELVVPISQSVTLASQIAPLVTRTLPVVLPPYIAPSKETRTIRVLAPAGFQWSELPPGGDASGGEFGSAHLEIARDPKDARAVVITRTVIFNMDYIPVDKYAAWRGWVQRVDALMHKGVRLVPGGAK
jgi:hypothetical protein